MKFNKEFSKSYKLLGMMIILSTTTLLITNFVTSYAFAENSQSSMGGDVSSKIRLGDSVISSNSSAQASVSAGNSNEKTQTGSNESAEMQVTTKSEANMEMQHNKNYMSSYSKMSADSENSFTVEANHHLYQPGDNVKVEGSIWSGLETEIGGVNQVTIQVLDNKGTVVSTQTAQVDSNGEYSADFTLPADVGNGAYTINSKIDVAANVLGSLTLKAQASLQSSEKIVIANSNAVKVKAEGKDFDVKIASNSDVSNIQFDGQAKTISFTVSGETGTSGVTEITIPKSLLSGNLNVMIDGHLMSQNDVIETVNADTETTLEINYHHSTHTIAVSGTNAVPEFPVSIIILTVAVGSIFVISLKNRSLVKI